VRQSDILSAPVWHSGLQTRWAHRLKSLCSGGILLSCRFMALAPKNIQQIGNELAIQWSDGGESYLDLELLRRACPCAACGGEPDVLGNVLRPEVSHTDASFQLDSFVVVGGYALQPRWHDGHNTGIYSFQYLQRLSSGTTPT
jgi:DUF971 family protein